MNQLDASTESRLRQGIRDIDTGKGRGFTHAYWLASSKSKEAAQYFITGLRGDCVTLWHAPTGRSKREECTVVGFSTRSLQHVRYADIAECLEAHINNKGQR